MTDRTCCEDGCDEPRKRKNGMCDKHYRLALDELKPPCWVDECPEKSHLKGLCASHYDLRRKYGETMAPPPKRVTIKPKCAIEECPESAYCRGWCSKHYVRWRAHGDPRKVIAPKRAMRLSPADVDTESKVCSTCKRNLPLSAYYRRAETPDGLQYRCKDCIRDATNKKFAEDPEFRAQRKRYARTRPEAQRERSRQRQRRNLGMYGLTMDEFEKMAAAQGGVCAICGKPPYGDHENPRKTRLSVDHDHETRKVRGLLCDVCNVGLGHFKDNPDLLAAAIRYLHETGTVIPITRARKRQPGPQPVAQAEGLW